MNLQPLLLVLRFQWWYSWVPYNFHPKLGWLRPSDKFMWRKHLLCRIEAEMTDPRKRFIFVTAVLSVFLKYALMGVWIRSATWRKMPRTMNLTANFISTLKLTSWRMRIDDAIASCKRLTGEVSWDCVVTLFGSETWPTKIDEESGIEHVIFSGLLPSGGFHFFQWSDTALVLADMHLCPDFSKNIIPKSRLRLVLSFGSQLHTFLIAEASETWIFRKWRKRRRLRTF
jgi:hypothetical protein